MYSTIYNFNVNISFVFQVLLKYTEYNEPHESLTNRNIIEVHKVRRHLCASDRNAMSMQKDLPP